MKTIGKILIASIALISSTYCNENIQREKNLRFLDDSDAITKDLLLAKLKSGDIKISGLKGMAILFERLALGGEPQFDMDGGVVDIDEKNTAFIIDYILDNAPTPPISFTDAWVEVLKERLN